MPAHSIDASSAPISTYHYKAGDLIRGKYLLDRVLGEGGMGSVWLAHNMDLDAPVAIKLVHADVAQKEAGNRLKREARAEAQIEHPAIVRVFDCGETELGYPFIVMEHLEGMSFADALEKKGPLAATSAARILLPIIDGLSAAHDKGIVHRDIKPENIFLARGSRHIQPKVVDFGIAKLDRWDPNPAITLQGTVIGSPSYMAPEQARGQNDVDHRADIWAVCAVLYEAVTGSPPFRGDSYNAILQSIVAEEVTPLTNARGNVAVLWKVLERGLAKDRTARFQSMQELGSALAQFLLACGVTEDVCGDSIATAWKMRSDAHPPSNPVPASPASSAVRPVLALVTPSLDDARMRDDAPTSTSGLSTPTGHPPERRHGTFLPSAAAALLLGTMAFVAWKSIAARTGATAAASLGAQRSEAPSLAPATHGRDPAHPVVVPVPSGPTGSLARAPATRQTTPIRTHDEAAPKRRHGWPAPTAQTPSRPNIADLRQPEPRDRKVDDETVHSLGLKTYR